MEKRKFDWARDLNEKRDISKTIKGKRKILLLLIILLIIFKPSFCMPLQTSPSSSSLHQRKTLVVAYLLFGEPHCCPVVVVSKVQTKSCVEVVLFYQSTVEVHLLSRLLSSQIIQRRLHVVRPEQIHPSRPRASRA